MKTEYTENNDSTGNISHEFDQEYTLTELISESFFNKISEDIRMTGGTHLSLVNASGVIFYSSFQDTKIRHKKFSHLIKEKNLLNTSVIALTKNEILLPITHQLEIIGYLIIEFASEPAWQKEKFNMMIGSLIGELLKITIKNSYQNLLTSGLHKQVVRDSFYEINKKAKLLEKSEEKYRLLAESLEKEVKIKAEEIKLTQAKLMHQEKLASIGQLAAGVAHEINNPMGFISSNLKTLKEYTQDLTKIIKEYRNCLLETDAGNQYKEKLNALKILEEQLDIDFLLNDIPSLIDESTEGAGRVNKIVSDLKDFAHPGDEKPAFADINTCINSTLNIVWSEIKYKAEVEKQLNELPQIYCFPQQLNQVIMNLLVNSAHAIEKTGKIIIITKDAGEFIEINISDNGSGIQKEHLGKIFDPFFTTKAVGQGTGLGLNLAYNIIQKHNGTINVKSTIGMGTQFIIKLPVNPEL